jgi:hypothetical protein
MTPVEARHAIAEHVAKMPPAEACIICIIDLYLASTRAGTEQVMRENFAASQEILAAYVDRYVTNPEDHATEACAVLRTMVSSDPESTTRLLAWYKRDVALGHGGEYPRAEKERA